MDELKLFVGLFCVIWGVVFMYHFACYCYGDKSLALNLIDNLSKKPSVAKKNIALKIGAGGGVLVIYSFIYPFIRYRRRKNKSLSFDLFMWANWLFFMILLFIILLFN